MGEKREEIWHRPREKDFTATGRETITEGERKDVREEGPRTEIRLLIKHSAGDSRAKQIEIKRVKSGQERNNILKSNYLESGCVLWE